MNDIIWYSRFAVLVGALVLLVQAVAGRAQGLITLVAILLLCVGFLVFVSALAMQGLNRPSTEAPDEIGAAEDPPGSPPNEAEPPGPESEEPGPEYEAPGADHSEPVEA